MLTDQQHLITPPPELVAEWCRNWTHAHGEFGVYLATKAARWGADQELEAYSELLLNSAPWTVDPHERPEWVQTLKRCRRSKPPSLAEQATTELAAAVIRGDCITTSDAIPSLRAALERLQELESNG